SCLQIKESAACQGNSKPHRRSDPEITVLHPLTPLDGSMHPRVTFGVLFAQVNLKFLLCSPKLPVLISSCDGLPDPYPQFPSTKQKKTGKQAPQMTDDRCPSLSSDRSRIGLKKDNPAA